MQSTPYYKVSVHGLACTLTIGFDKNFSVSAVWEFTLTEEESRAAGRVLDELNTGLPVDRHFIGRMSIWTRPASYGDPNKVIDIRENANLSNFKLSLKYTPENVEFLKAILRDMANRKY